MRFLLLKPGLILLLLFSSEFAFGQDWANLGRYKSADSILKNTTSDQATVVFMGNSITDNWIKLSPNFFSENPYVNRGISGQTTPQMLVRFRQDVIKLKPQIVVILAGTNDIAGNTGFSTLEMIQDNIASMADLAKVNDIKVILCSLTPANHYPWSPKVEPAQKIIQLNTWIKNYAEKNNFSFCNYYPLLVNEEGGMRKAYSKDGVHPNLKGYKVMEPLIKEKINEILNTK